MSWQTRSSASRGQVRATSSNPPRHGEVQAVKCAVFSFREYPSVVWQVPGPGGGVICGDFFEVHS
ncbi:MAG: hypothetical protein MJE63_04740, partial [Proteobacteria bacterium]|nr:hypothetical protein [Pseudomonadota bacterium]